MSSERHRQKHAAPIATAAADHIAALRRACGIASAPPRPQLVTEPAPELDLERARLDLIDEISRVSHELDAVQLANGDTTLLRHRLDELTTAARELGITREDAP